MTHPEEEWRRHYEWRARAFENDSDIIGYSAHGIATRMRVVRSLLDQFSLPARADILDVGCGVGLYVRGLRSEGYRAVGIDFSLPSLRRALISDHCGGQYVAGEAYALPFGDESFDLAVSLGVVTVVSDPVRVLREVARVLRPGARLVIEALNGCSIVGRAWRLREAMTGKPRYMKMYDRTTVDTWLATVGLSPEGTRGIYVTPPPVRRLTSALDRPRLQAALDRHARVGDLAAHALLFVGRKREGRR